MKLKYSLALFTVSSFVYASGTFSLPNNYSSNYTQTRLIKSVGITLKSSGIIKVKDASQLVWKQLKPFENIIQIGNDSLLSGSGTNLKEDNSVFAKYISQLVFTVLKGDEKSLEKQFTISKVKGVLMLTPKDEVMSQAIKTITVKGKDIIKEVIMTETSGNIMHIKFSK